MVRRFADTGSAVPIFRTDGELLQESTFQYYEADLRGAVDGSPIVQLVASGPQAEEAVGELQALFEREFDIQL